MSNESVVTATSTSLGVKPGSRAMLVKFDPTVRTTTPFGLPVEPEV
jgi:hypothetical protein